MAGGCVAACAPSKLNDPAPVPTTAPTDRKVDRVPPPYAADAHATLVPDVHDALLHATASTIDGVGSFALKSSPEIVMKTPAHGTMLDGLVPVRTGAKDTKRRVGLSVTPVAGRCMRTAHRRS